MAAFRHKLVTTAKEIIIIILIIQKGSTVIGDMHSFGYLFGVLCISSTYSAAQVEFNTTTRIYAVGDNVKLSCFINTSWMVVSFYRRNTILIGDCFAPSNVCFPTNHTVSQKRYTLFMDNLNPVLYINNVTKEDSGVQFTCLWTSFRDTVSFHVQDPIPTPSPSSDNEENETNINAAIVVSVLVALTFILLVIGMVRYVCMDYNGKQSRKIASQTDTMIAPQEDRMMATQIHVLEDVQECEMKESQKYGMKASDASHKDRLMASLKDLTALNI